MSIKISFAFINNIKTYRFEFPHGIGHSEYNPYPQLFYPSIEEVDQQLRQSSDKDLQAHFLVKNALYDISLFQKIKENEIESFKNHSLCFQKKLYPLGNKIKLKLSGDLLADLKIIDQLKEEFTQLRLDLNYKYDQHSITKLFKKLPLEKVEYIEDPCPFSLKLYRTLALQFPIALDHTYNLKKLKDSSIKHYILRLSLIHISEPTRPY